MNSPSFPTAVTPADANHDSQQFYDTGAKSSIQAVSADCARLVDLGENLVWLDESLGGDAARALGYPWLPAEGPVWFHEDSYLLLSDIGRNLRLKWSPEEGMSVVATDTQGANGMTRDLQRRLIICEHMTQRLVRIEHDGSLTVLADRYQGKRLNRPNDVVVKSDGAVYFTDPFLPIITKIELDFAGVYRLAPDGNLTLLCDDLIVPNGLCFSPGETVLYVSDTRAHTIYAYDVRDDGMLGARRTFAILRDERLGLVDGMKVDLEGNVYCTGPGGVWIISPDGRHLGTITVGPGKRATNLAWGGPDWRTLYITTTRALASIRMRVRGVPVPGRLAQP